MKILPFGNWLTEWKRDLVKAERCLCKLLATVSCQAMSRQFAVKIYIPSVANWDVPAVNDLGYGHLVFEVCDLYQTIEEVQWFGGGLQGEVTNLGTEERPHLTAYVRDNEDEILELEQPSIAGKRSSNWF